MEVLSDSVKQHTTRRLRTQARAVQFLAGVGYNESPSETEGCSYTIVSQVCICTGI